MSNMERAIKSNLQWFLQSGVMDPADGTWGVAERVLLAKGNEALGKTLSDFDSYTPYEGYYILEHRRPDCNFEVALLFLLAARAFGNENYRNVGRNLVRYLYRRSGCRTNTASVMLPGIWGWATPPPHLQQSYWLDDNSWDVTLSLLISELDPLLDAELNLRQKGLESAYALCKYFDRMLKEEDPPTKLPLNGADQAPHFSALALMACAKAWHHSREDAFLKPMRRYLELVAADGIASNVWLVRGGGKLTPSEHTYLILGLSCCAGTPLEERAVALACRSADFILSIMDENGNIPSKHFEAPQGDHLVDLIYTQNWATLGLVNLVSVTGKTEYARVLKKSMDMLVAIQDSSPQKHLCGCWRGMYDLDAGTWGGGDEYEGGAGSIYTGWTNAPISLALLMQANGWTLLHGGQR